MRLCTLNARPGARLWSWDWISQPEVWSTAWKVTKCVSAVVLVVAPLGKGLKRIKDFGGIRKTAELIVKAGNWSDLQEVAPWLAAEILGVSAIEAECF